MELMTEPVTVKLNPLHPDPSVVSRTVEVLLADGVVVAPTETQYGLLARADREDAVTRVYRLKGRPRSRAMAIFLRTLEAASSWAEVTPLAYKLAERFWPGPLTLILAKCADRHCPAAIGATVGIRVSSAPLVAELTRRVDFPITATSANVSGAGELSSIGEIRSVFGSGTDLYLDGGTVSGAPSTVVDCRGHLPLILREGALSAGSIMRSIERAAP